MILEPEYSNPILIALGVNWLIDRKFFAKAAIAAREPWLIFAFTYFLISLFGMLWTDYMDSGSHQLETLLSIWVFPFAFAFYPPLSTKQKRLILVAFALGIWAIQLYCIAGSFQSQIEAYGALSPFDLSLFTYNDLAQPLGFQPIYFSLYTFSVLILWQVEYMKSGSGWRSYEKWVYWLMNLFFLVFLVFLSARTSIGVYLMWTLFRSILLVRRPKPGFAILWGLAEWLIVIVLLFSSDVNKTRFSEALDPDSDYKTDQYSGRSMRVEKWDCAFKAIRQKPIQGWGTGSEQEVMLVCFKEKDIAGAINWKYNAHNQYLSTSLQLGVFGFLPLLAFLLWPAWVGYKRRNLSLMVLSLAFMICNLTETMLSRRWGVFYVGIVIGIQMVLYQREPEKGFLPDLKKK